MYWLMHYSHKCFNAAYIATLYIFSNFTAGGICLLKVVDSLVAPFVDVFQNILDDLDAATNLEVDVAFELS